MVNNKEAQRLCRVIPANNCGFHSKRNRSKPEKGRFSFKDYIPNRGKYTYPSNFTTRNYSNRATKETARGLIQRYKSCYSQKRVIQEHSGRKTLVGKKRCMIRNIANPFLAPTLLPDMFCNKNNAISPESIEGETTKTSTQRMAPTDRKGF